MKRNTPSLFVSGKRRSGIDLAALGGKRALGAGDLLVPGSRSPSQEFLQHRHEITHLLSHQMYELGLSSYAGNRVWRRMRGCGLFCLQNLFAPQVWFQFSFWNLDQTMLSTSIPFSQIVDVGWTLQTACGTWFFIALRRKYRFAFKVYMPSTQYISTVY